MASRSITCSHDRFVTRLAVLDQIAGYRPGDTFVAPPPERPFAKEVGADPGRLRIGLLDRATADDYVVDPECSEAVLATGRLLESLGHSVELAHPASLGEADYQRHFLVVVSDRSRHGACSVVGRPRAGDFRRGVRAAQQTAQ